MLDSKIDLFGKKWLDVVFDQKNKSYGAYQLRRQSSSNTTTALFFTSAAFVLLFLSPKIISLIKGASVEPIVETQRVVDILPPPPVNPEVVPPASVEPPKAKENTIEFPPPVVLQDHLVHDDVPPQIDELKNATPGQKTIEGAEDGEIVVTQTPGTGPKNAAAVGDNNSVYEYVTLEVQPTFPGGMEKFYTYLKNTVKYPGAAQELGVQGKVFVSFIIEKNGELTDIKVDRKLGAGTDEEAIRVLKASPRWIPGIQNGRPVRVKYNIPISFSMPQ